MKIFLILGLALTGFLASEFGTGLREAPPQPNPFDTPRVFKNGVPRADLARVRLMTWNIERGGALEKIGGEMASNPSDLCLLQEVDLDTRRDGGIDETAELARRLGMSAAFGIEFEELSQENGRPAYIGQATLTRLPLLASRVLRFERQSTFWKPHRWVPSSVPLLQRHLGSRIALVTELEFHERLLVAYNVHLESRSAGPIQVKQLDEIFQDSRRYPPATAFIIGGDLNTKYLPSLFLHKLERAGYRSASGERIERTHTLVMALDWIFAKGPVQLKDGSVRRDIKGSDHYPVYAELAGE